MLLCSFAATVAGGMTVPVLSTKSCNTCANPADDPREVSGAARLLLERVVELHPLRYGLAVGDLRLAGLAVDFVLAAHALDVDVQVEFAHAADDCFLRFGVDVDAEGGVFALETVHGFGEVGGVFVVFRFYGKRYDWFGDEHGGLCRY